MSLPWIVGCVAYVAMMARAIWVIADAPLSDQSEFVASLHNGGQWEAHVCIEDEGSEPVAARTG